MKSAFAILFPAGKTRSLFPRRVTFGVAFFLAALALLVAGCEEEEPGSSLTLEAPAAELEIGQTMQMAAFFDDPGNGVEGQDVTNTSLWWTLNPVVAEVDGQGLVTPGSPGQTRVMVEYAGLAAETDLTVVLDTTPPFVVSTDPPEGQTNVAITQGILFTFSETMNYGATAGAVDVQPSPGGLNVSASGEDYTVSPSGTWSNNTLYTITIFSTAADINGNQMAGDFVYTFTTVP